MLKDEARKYIESELKYGEQRKLYNYNCAETLLNACNDYYKLGLDKKTFKAIVPFGGGFYSEKACGVLTGGIAALGVMYSEDKPTDNNKVKEITQQWVKAFEEEFSHSDCKEIKPIYRNPETGCTNVILRAAELLESIIESKK